MEQRIARECAVVVKLYFEFHFQAHKEKGEPGVKLTPRRVELNIRGIELRSGIRTAIVSIPPAVSVDFAPILRIVDEQSTTLSMDAPAYILSSSYAAFVALFAEGKPKLLAELNALGLGVEDVIVEQQMGRSIETVPLVVSKQTAKPEQLEFENEAALP